MLLTSDIDIRMCFIYVCPHIEPVRTARDLYEMIWVIADGETNRNDGSQLGRSEDGRFDGSEAAVERTTGLVTT